MKLVIEPIWSWPTCLVVSLCLVAMVAALYPPRVRHLPKIPRRLLLSLRFASALALAFAMFRPTIQVTETDKKSAVLAILGDASRSMNTKDGPGGITRRQALIKTIDDAQPQLELLEKRIDVRYFDFDSQLHAGERPKEKAEGRQTAYGAILEAILRETQSQRIVSMVLMGDGAQRAVSPYDIDPRAIARRLGELQVPVHTIPFGASGISDSSLDLALEDLIVDPLVFEKKTVPVTAKVRVLGAAGHSVTVRLLVEDHSTKATHQAGKMQIPAAAHNAKPSDRLQTNQNSDILPVELSYVPQMPGEYKIAVEVIPLDGELKTRNNRQETIITVKKGGVRVAYFDKFRPELQSVALLRESDDIQLDRQVVRSGRFKHLTRIDAEWFQEGKYDVYIVGDVPAEVFGAKLLNKMKQRVDEGAGLLMIGGFRSFGAGGYARTPLADVLPVAMSHTETEASDQISSDLHYTQDVKLVPTQSGLNHYVMRLDPLSAQQNRETWQKIPALRGANKLRAKNDFVQVLAKSANGLPLLFAHTTGRARVMAFAGDTTYLWSLQGFADETLRFWQQMIHWLARKELDRDQAVWVQIEPRNFNPGTQVSATFGARDQTGLPLTDVQFTVEVTTPDGEKHPITALQANNQFTGSFLNTQQSGDYRIRVTAAQNGESIGNPATARFLVNARDLELDNPVADLGLLEEIAALTGGSDMPPEQLGSYFNRLLKDGIPNLEETLVKRTTLWDNWYFLGLFVALLSAEWLIRKRRGLV